MKIGIDPGLTGAIAFLNDDLSFIKVVDMPTLPLANKNKRQVNGAELTKLLNLVDSATVYIEQVNAMPGQGVTSMFHFGLGYGIVLGVCAGLYLPIVLVRPIQWKKKCNLVKKPKDYARTIAQQLYPQAELARVKDLGRAEALLIARFGDIN